MQKPTVSNGPFKLVTYQKGQYVEFEANKEYFKGTPKIDALYMKIMPGANITAQLQSGEIDMNEPNIGLIPFEDTDKVKGMPGIVTDGDRRSKCNSNVNDQYEYDTRRQSKKGDFSRDKPQDGH